MADMVIDTCAVHRAVQSACDGGGEAGSPVTLDMFLRGRLSVLSRVFQTNHDSTLVPVVDFLNHASDFCPNVSWGPSRMHLGVSHVHRHLHSQVVRSRHRSQSLEIVELAFVAWAPRCSASATPHHAAPGRVLFAGSE